MMVAMATDLRVILIKLADRLHNMRTLSGASEAEADREGPRDARDLRAARPPARDPRDQVGARGPLVPAPAPAQVRRDQEARLPAAGRARALRHGGRRVPAATSSTKVGIEAEISGRAKHFYSIYSKMTKKGREFNEIYDLTAMRVLVELGQGLLRRDRDHPLDLEAAARALQGLHRDAQAQPLPGAPHDGDRARGPAAGDPDPHPGHARDRRVRDRRARHLQGGPQPKGDPRARQDDLAAPAPRGRGRPGPDRVPRVAQGRPVRGRGLRVHAEGRGEEPVGGLDAARLRLRGPHRRRPPLRRREGQRQDRPAALPAASPATSSRSSPRSRSAGRPGTGWRWCERAGRATRSAPSSSASGATDAERRGREAAPGRRSGSAGCRRSGSRPRRCSPT